MDENMGRRKLLTAAVLALFAALVAGCIAPPNDVPAADMPADSTPETDAGTDPAPAVEPEPVGVQRDDAGQDDSDVSHDDPGDDDTTQTPTETPAENPPEEGSEGESGEGGEGGKGCTGTTIDLSGDGCQNGEDGKP